MTTWLWVALGSALGGGLRHILGEWMQWLWQPALPWDTWLANVSGSLLIGFYAALTEVDGYPRISGQMHQFVIAGLLGGYTTFSVFSLETLELLGRSPGLGMLNMLFTLFGALLAVWLGYRVVTRWNRPAG